MAHRRGRVFSHWSGSWVGLQEGQAHTLMRREVKRAVSTTCPSPAHASEPQAPNPGKLLPTCAQRLTRPTWAATLSGGAQDHAFLLFPWADVPGSSPRWRAGL